MMIIGWVQWEGAAVEQQLLEMKASGWGDKDTKSLILLLERLAGVEVRAPQL